MIYFITLEFMVMRINTYLKIIANKFEIHLAIKAEH